MEVTLHVGAHRTATTTFQRHLAANRDFLRDTETVFWGPKVIRGGLFRSMAGASGSYLPWQSGRAAKRVALRLEGLRQDGVRRVILSDENMLGNLRDVLEDTLLYPNAAARVGGFAQAFQGHDLTIAIGVRCYSNWWPSALAVRLSRGGPLPRPRLRECMVTQPRRWRHMISQIAGAAPDARIVVWTYEAMGGTPHRILQEATGVETPATSMPILNASPRAKAVRDLLRGLDINAEQFPWPASDRFMPFEAFETDALRAQYQDDLTWLANGADGLADYIDVTPTKSGAQTVDGRGIPDDGEHRNLA
jgi:hypothetical protein